MIKVRDIKIDAKDKSEELIKKKLLKKLNIKEDDILEYEISKESIDARRIPVYLIYEINVKLKDERKIHFNKDIIKENEVKYNFNAEGKEEL
jgi:uncharacterized FAD-dependent dehydrogenase